MPSNALTPSTREHPLQLGPLRIYPEQRLVLNADQPLRLSGRALDILLVLLEHPGEVISRQTLMSRVWPNSVVEDSNLRVHMAALRKALGDGQAGQRYIVTVAQRGYSLVAPVLRLQQPAPGPDSDMPTHLNHNLPARQARMIGRQPLIEALGLKLQTRRLITLTGPGGIGKTCVALQVAHTLTGHYRDGIRWLDLAAISDPLRVAAQLAALLDQAPADGDALGQLCSWLRDRHLLLVIDNCEHLIDAIAVLCERILRSAPQVQILATSRESLRAEGEVIQRLDALACPPTTLTSQVEAMSFAALQLFVERAMHSQAHFDLSPASLALASDICRRLEGIPLAIELAAAQLASLGLEGLHAQLKDNPGLGIAAHPGSSSRHQTLLATLDWSFHLLEPVEQVCLCRLAVFKSRFSLESALAVAGDPTLSEAVLCNTISQLANKSLVSVEASDDQVFYRLLDTTRHYALAKLRQRDELPETLRRHAEHCLALMQQARHDWLNLPTGQWMQRYTRSLEDIREVLDWGLNGEGPQALAISLVAHSTPLWQELSLLKEHGMYVRKALQALQHSDRPCPQQELQLRLALGNYSYHSRGASLETLDAFHEARRLAAQGGDADGLLRAVSGLTAVNLCAGDYQAAVQQSRQFEQLGATPVTDLSALRLQVLALHYSGQQHQARQCAEQALQRLSQSGRMNRFSHGFGIQYDQSVAALTIQARILWLQGRLAEARRSADQALEIALQIEHGLSICYTLALAGCPIALYEGQTQRAHERVRQLRAHAHKHSVLLFYTWSEHYARLLDLPVQPARPATGLLRDILLTLRGATVDARQLERARNGEAGWCAAEILRCHAQQQADEVAENLLQHALDIARQQGAVLWEMRSALGLAQLWLRQQRPAPARDLLQQVLGTCEADCAMPEQHRLRGLLQSL